ncbi:MAG TPA: phosphoribosyl-AMP cyclohydrolase [Gammaproteobacteria bacterium]|nr:phosphoribosyl-AMP cyclohydrolase [Xanthomonadales bacterium]MCB1593411.1 phosphoribosyl-AMP cyclohydrolase [Xanthomonadales bacterium]HOP22515.1 phosphoribosyl-AMP cyclohydrolase [Gammaproteobacteria bacterium]HPI96539.1 phosphoribosyl-AMP cyclohydrolase [Gammaproteobacteria bacterium]HPQ87892.1 phosphoribosyl-AMP cyclohydrolase [Gammaproteobacteria bacterium]
MLIPSIDLLDGKAVQLQQGKAEKKIIERKDVFQLLEEFSLYGEVAIIDLNAAMGTGSNQQLIEQMLAVKTCRVGGGIRDLETAKSYLAAGATKIIMGTSARSDFVSKLPKDALIFAIDAKGDFLSTHGWQTTQSEKVLDIIPQLAQNCGEFLYTQIQNEGMMGGIDKDRIRQVIDKSPVPVTVAGGISSYLDLQWINNLGANSQIGMAIYSGKMSLDKALMSLIDFEKAPLVPTVVQDDDTYKVLMLAYSSQESLQTALSQKTGTYYSRSRNEIWTKGLSSGNTQELINVDVDCDGDTLLFKVRQKNNACHFDRYSCFASQRKEYSLDYLDEIFKQRINDAETSEKLSFSQKLLTDFELQQEKLREECQELIEAADHNHVRWEAADLMFFTLAMAKSKGVSFKEILNDLRSRNDAR